MFLSSLGRRALIAKMGKKAIKARSIPIQIHTHVEPTTKSNAFKSGLHYTYSKKLSP